MKLGEPTYLGHTMRNRDSDARFLEALLRHGLSQELKFGERPEPITQAEAARRAGMSRPSVSALAQRWGAGKRAGLVLSGSDGLTLRPTAGYALAVEFGHEHSRIALFDIHGQLFTPADPKQYERSTKNDADPDDGLGWACDRAEELIAEAGVASGEVLAVGIAVAGPVDQEDGSLVRDSWSLGGDWSYVSPRVELEQRLRWPASYVIDNDANLGAVAEHLWGAGRDREHILYVKWGEGIGAGIISGNAVLRGERGLAGEIGHTLVPPDLLGSRSVVTCSRCGRKGCLETVASLGALRTQCEGQQSAEEFETAIRARVPGVREAVIEAATAIGVALVPVIDTVNPAVVIIGGHLGGVAYPTVAAELNRAIATVGGHLNAGEGAGVRTSPSASRIRTAGGTTSMIGSTVVRGAAALALMATGVEQLQERTEPRTARAR